MNKRLASLEIAVEAGHDADGATDRRFEAFEARLQSMERQLQAGAAQRSRPPPAPLGTAQGGVGLKLYLYPERFQEEQQLSYFSEALWHALQRSPEKQRPQLCGAVSARGGLSSSAH